MTFGSLPNAKPQKKRRNSNDTIMSDIVACSRNVARITLSLRARGDWCDDRNRSGPDWDPTAVRVKDFGTSSGGRHHGGARGHFRRPHDLMKSGTAIDLHTTPNRIQSGSYDGLINSESR
jgi:hypothetical protein